MIAPMLHRMNTTMTFMQGMLMRSAVAALEMGQASAITLGHRLPMLAAMPFFPQPESLFELNRMVTEKLAVAIEGSVAAGGETAILAASAAFGRAGPVELATGMFSIAEAATHPARRQVHANARRLSR